MLKVNVFIGSIVYILLLSIKLSMFIIYFKLRFTLLNVFEHYGRNICISFLSFYSYNCLYSLMCNSEYQGTHIFLLQSLGSQACATLPRLSQVLRLEKYRSKKQRKGKWGGGRKGIRGKRTKEKKWNYTKTSSLIFSILQILALHACGKVIYTCILSIIST